LTPVAEEIVGRAEELATIHDFLGVTEPKPAALLIEGEAGIGKSTLWRCAVDAAQQRGMRVLASRPSSADQGLAFAGLGDLFDDVVEDVLPSLTRPRRRAVESALLLDGAADPVDPRALGVATRDVLHLLASDRPLIVAVDDVQWLDHSSSRALTFAVRRLESAVLFVLARRIDGSATALDLERALPGESVGHAWVGPLSFGATQRLLQTRLGRTFARPTLRRIHATSGGNPFFALEIARALPDLVDASPSLPVPESLDDLMAARLAGLPERTHAGLDVVAATGDASWGLLCDAGVEPSSLDPALAAQVLESTPATVRFAHPLLASVYYRRLPQVRRQQAHRLLAGLVAEPVEQARHLALATEPPDEATAATIDSAAESASARGAIAAAVELREHALRLTPPDDEESRFRRMTALARGCLSNANASRAQELVGELLQRHRHGRHRAESLVLAADLHQADATPSALLRAALEEARDDPVLLCRINQRLGWELRFAGDPIAAARHASAASALAEQIGEPNLLASTLATVAGARHHVGIGDALSFAERAYALAIETDEPSVRAEVAGTLVTTFLWTGHHERLRGLFEPFCDELAERDEVLATEALWTLGLIEFVARRFERAAELVRSSCELSTVYGDADFAGLWALAVIDTHLGELDAARRAAELGRNIVGERSPRYAALLEAALGLIAMWSGDPDGAAGRFALAERWRDDSQSVEPTFPIWRADHVEALLTVGRVDEALTLLDDWERRATRLGRSGVLAEVDRCRGLIAASDGDLATAARLLERSAAEHARNGDPFSRARALLALGSVRRRARQKRGSREAIDTSIALFDECGAAGWADRARAELGAIGGRTRQPGLTAAERRVAGLVAEGRTNREVAAALFLGERTVETHLTHIYAKLAVRSRTELARTLAPVD
jgi:DNA-binding CsgD family transcriptional regulator